MRRQFVVTVEVEASNSLGLFSEAHFRHDAARLWRAVEKVTGFCPEVPMHCVRVELPPLYAGGDGWAIERDAE